MQTADDARVAHKLLGLEELDEQPSPSQIRRAYRRSVVVTHRTRVLDLVSHLEMLKWAYATLKAPRSDVTIHRGPSALITYARERARHSDRISAAAVAENAEAVQWLADEHDRRARADELVRARRAARTRILQGLVLFVALAALAAVAFLR